MRNHMLRAVSGSSSIVLEGYTVGSDAGGEYLVTATGLGHSTGDIGVLCVAHGTLDTNETLTGWTEIKRKGTLAPESILFVRTMVDTDTTFISSGSGFNSTVWSLLIFSGCASEPIATDASQDTSSGVSDPQAPAETGGQDATVIFGCLDSDYLGTPPSGYTDLGVITQGASRATIQSAWLNNSGSQTPGAWSGSTDGNWNAFTLGLFSI
jgi:hypothetical protein